MRFAFSGSVIVLCLTRPGGRTLRPDPLLYLFFLHVCKRFAALAEHICPVLLPELPLLQILIAAQLNAIVQSCPQLSELFSGLCPKPQDARVRCLRPH